MESALPLVTRLRNDTVHSIDFSVENGTCPIPSLKSGGRRLVNLSDVVKICRRLESDRWLIKVLIDKIITGMTLDARQFLRSVIITFKIGRIRDGKFELIAEAIEEKPIDIVLRLGRGIGFVLRRNVLWNRRQSAIIARSLPLNMHQIRARNMCCDVPEAIVNLNTTMPPVRMEESRQGDVNVVPEAIVNMDTTRARYILDTIFHGMEESRQGDVNVVPEAIVNMDTTRAPYILDTIFHGEERTSHPDGIVRRKMLTSPERSPQREGTDSDFHHHHSQQLLTELMECDNRPHPSNALNVDGYNHMFLFAFSLLLVSFIRVLLWATY